MISFKCLIWSPSYRVNRKRWAPWNRERKQNTNRYTRTNGGRIKASSVSSLGGSSHPKGKAMANKNRWTGINSADTLPPALKRSHRKGSFDRLLIYARNTIQATQRLTSTQAA